MTAHTDPNKLNSGGLPPDFMRGVLKPDALLQAIASEVVDRMCAAQTTQESISVGATEPLAEAHLGGNQTSAYSPKEQPTSAPTGSSRDESVPPNTKGGGSPSFKADTGTDPSRTQTDTPPEPHPSGTRAQERVEEDHDDGMPTDFHFPPVTFENPIPASPPTKTASSAGTPSSSSQETGDKKTPVRKINPWVWATVGGLALAGVVGMGLQFMSQQNINSAPALIDASSPEKAVTSLNSILTPEVLRGDANPAPVTINYSIEAALLAQYKLTDGKWKPLLEVGTKQQVRLPLSLQDGVNVRLRSIASPENKPLYTVSSNEEGKLIVTFDRGQLVPTFDRDVSLQTAANGTPDKIKLSKIGSDVPIEEQPMPPAVPEEPINESAASHKERLDVYKARLAAMKADPVQAAVIASLIIENPNADPDQQLNDGLLQIAVASSRVIGLANAFADEAVVKKIALGLDQAVATYVGKEAQANGIMIAPENVQGAGAYVGMGKDWEAYFTGNKAPTDQESVQQQEFIKNASANPLISPDTKQIVFGSTSVSINLGKP